MKWLIALPLAVLLAAVAYYAPRNCSVRTANSTHVLQCAVPGIEAYQGASHTNWSALDKSILPTAQRVADFCGCSR